MRSKEDSREKHSQSSEQEDGANGSFPRLRHLEPRHRVDRQRQNNNVGENIEDRSAREIRRIVNAAATGYRRIPVILDRDAAEYGGEEGCNTSSDDDGPHDPQADSELGDRKNPVVHEEYRYFDDCDVQRVHEKAPIGSLHVSSGF